MTRGILLLGFLLAACAPDYEVVEGWKDVAVTLNGGPTLRCDALHRLNLQRGYRCYQPDGVVWFGPNEIHMMKSVKEPR